MIFAHQHSEVYGTEWRKLARAALSSEFAPLPPRRLLPLPPLPLPPRPLLPISLSSPDYIHPPPFKYLTLQLFDDDDDDNIDKAGVLNILKPVLKSVEHFCHLSDNSSNDQFRASTSPSSFFCGKTEPFLRWSKWWWEVGGGLHPSGGGPHLRPTSSNCFPNLLTLHCYCCCSLLLQLTHYNMTICKCLHSDTVSVS